MEKAFRPYNKQEIVQVEIKILAITPNKDFNTFLAKFKSIALYTKVNNFTIINLLKDKVNYYLKVYIK